MNATMGWDNIPACAIGGVIQNCFRKFCRGPSDLGNFFGDRAHILIQNMDVTNVFRNIPKAPDDTTVFGCMRVGGRYLCVDLRLQFVWRGRRGWRG